MMEKTDMNSIADEEGFITVYPKGTGRFRNRFLTWDAGYCCGYALENNIDDVGFIKALIEELQNTFNIDPSRIYVTGHSNGAMLTYRLGAELSDIIAAIAPVAGSIGGYATENSSLWMIPKPTSPVSVIVIHGKLDDHVPYDGGHGVNTSGTRIDLSVNESIAFWVQHNKCNPIPQVNESDGVIQETYSGGQNGTEVVLYTLINGKHWWPGSEKDPTKELSATEIIWEFFEAHPKQ